MNKVASPPRDGHQSDWDIFEQSIRLTAREAGLVIHYQSDLDSDIARFKAMPSETFLWVATDIGCDALPLGVHPKSTEYLGVVLDSRIKQSTCKTFLVQPSAGRIKPIDPAKAVTALKTWKASYALGGGGEYRRTRDGALMGVLRCESTFIPGSGTYLLTYSWERPHPTFGPAFRSAVAYYEAVARHGMWTTAVPSDLEAAAQARDTLHAEAHLDTVS